MKILNYIKLLCPVIAVSAILYSCQDKWDDHIANSDSRVKNNIVEQITKESDLSEFTKLLVKSGLDKVIAQGNSYTVFAPNNAGLASLSANIVNNQDSLLNFIKNHIAVSTHRFGTGQDTLHITMLNGKIIDMVDNEIGEVAYTRANLSSGNGLYHILSKSLLPKENIWEYILNNASTYKQNIFISNLNTFDLFNSKSDQSDDVYENNEFLRNVYDLRSEEGKFTYFIYNDGTFDQEVDDFKKYVNYFSHADTTLAYSKFYTLKDLVFSGGYSKEDLPNLLISKSGVEVPIDKNAIVQSISLSNGYVHIINAPIVPIANKLKDVRKEGEDANSISTGGLRANYFFRVKKSPVGEVFNDFMVQNHKVSALEVGYNLPRMYTTTYKVYWRAVNDIQTNVFNQKLRIGGLWLNGILSGVIKDFGYFPVELLNYNEVYLGEFTLNNFINPQAYLIAAASAADGQNTITLDYLRFVPQVK